MKDFPEMKPSVHSRLFQITLGSQMSLMQHWYQIPEKGDTPINGMCVWLLPLTRHHPWAFEPARMWSNILWHSPPQSTWTIWKYPTRSVVCSYIHFTYAKLFRRSSMPLALAWGFARIWTAIAGFRVQSANRYTTKPIDKCQNLTNTPWFLLRFMYEVPYWVVRVVQTKCSTMAAFMLRHKRFPVAVSYALWPACGRIGGNLNMTAKVTLNVVHSFAINLLLQLHPCFLCNSSLLCVWYCGSELPGLPFIH